MKYSLREGLVLETVCDTTLLVATLEARKYCPYVMQLNDASNFIVQSIVNGDSIEKMAENAAKEYEISQEEAVKTIHYFISELKKKNYLVVKEE